MSIKSVIRTIVFAASVIPGFFAIGCTPANRHLNDVSFVIAEETYSYEKLNFVAVYDDHLLIGRYMTKPVRFDSLSKRKLMPWLKDGLSQRVGRLRECSAWSPSLHDDPSFHVWTTYTGTSAPSWRTFPMNPFRNADEDTELRQYDCKMMMAHTIEMCILSSADLPILRVTDEDIDAISRAVSVLSVMERSGIR